MSQTNIEKNKISRQRRTEAYDLIKSLAIESGVMQHQRDGHGYDEFIGLLQSGEFRLIFESSQIE